MSDTAEKSAVTTAQWIDEARLLLGFQLSSSVAEALWELAFLFLQATSPLIDECKQKLYTHFSFLLKEPTTWASRAEFLEHFLLLLEVEVGRRPTGAEIVSIFDLAASGKPLFPPKKVEAAPVVPVKPVRAEPGNQSQKVSPSRPQGTNQASTNQPAQKEQSKAEAQLDQALDALLGDVSKKPSTWKPGSPASPDPKVAKTAQEIPLSSDQRIEQLLAGIALPKELVGTNRPKFTSLGRLREGSIPDPDKVGSLEELLKGGTSKQGKSTGATTHADEAIEKLLGSLGLKQEGSKSKPASPVMPSTKPGTDKPGSNAVSQKPVVPTVEETEDEKLKRILGI